MKLSEVLFATDFSHASEPAGQLARDMALQSGARLHVVHVVPPVTDPGDSAERLRRLGATLGAGLRVETALLSGRVARQIIGYARDKGVGLIVLGTHGRTGVTRVILGSVAEGIVRLAPCPVLTVPSAMVEPEARAAQVAAAVTSAVRHQCLVCAGETEDLVCEPCRTRIRGEALERKIEAERPGRRGSPM